MDFRSLKYVTEACAGALSGGLPDVMVNRVCTDSRHAQKGDLFVALSGENFDGHNFLPEVIGQGVAAVVVKKAKADGLSGAVIAVENTRVALGKLGGRYRRDFDPAVIAVGGSNGKTSTKELIASVLRQKLPVIWSEASFNNEIGVPMTLLKLDTGTRAAVLEVGTNHPGELASLVDMIRPKLGVITSIGREHLEFFGDLAGVAKEEGALAEALPDSGTLFLTGDTPWAASIGKRAKANVVRLGLSENNDWQAKNLKMGVGGTEFEVKCAKTEFAGNYRIGLLGAHQVANALFAIAVGAELGLTPEEVRRGVAECKPAKMRLQSSNWNGICILDDSYNANADSVLAALETLKALPGAGKKIVVLGDMAELGAQSHAAHEEVGRKVAELGLDQLFAIGKMAGVILGAARSAGLNKGYEFPDAEAASVAVKKALQPGDTVLVKASRSARLERLVAALKPADATGKK